MIATVSAFYLYTQTTGHTYSPVWPDLAIYWILGNFLKPLSPINLSKSPTFLGNLRKGVKIYHFSSEIIFGQLLKTFGAFFWSHWRTADVGVCKWQQRLKVKLCLAITNNVLGTMANFRRLDLAIQVLVLIRPYPGHTALLPTAGSRVWTREMEYIE